jgi:predicted outer membrane repeat protein
LSKHLFIGFSNVYIEDTQFKGVSQQNPRRASMTDETLGSHIYAILSSKVWIKDTYFLDGISKLGGAMFIEGNSSIEMTKVFFQNNFARRKGGAVFANGFNLLKATG